MTEILNFSEDDARKRSREYYIEYGTTLAGLEVRRKRQQGLSNCCTGLKHARKDGHNNPLNFLLILILSGRMDFPCFLAPHEQFERRLAANGTRIDYDYWHEFIHGSLDYDKHLQPNPELRKLLQSIDLPRFVFTNADTEHAERCLSRIGISDCFEV
jgi:hypothetical protein